jgi:hypothetical protein
MHSPITLPPNQCVILLPKRPLLFFFIHPTSTPDVGGLTKAQRFPCDPLLFFTPPANEIEPLSNLLPGLAQPPPSTWTPSDAGIQDTPRISMVKQQINMPG